MARSEKPVIRVRSLARPLRAMGRAQEGAEPKADQTASHRKELAHERLRWIDIPRPTQEDVEALGREFGFHPLVLDDVLSRVQRPKLDDYDDYLFIVLHFPIFNAKEGVSVASEVDFFLGPDYVITTHNGELKPLLGMWARAEEDERARAEYMGGSAEMLLYHIVDRLTNYLFPMMRRIDINLDRLDERIFRDRAGRAVRELSDYRRDVISLRRIIRPNMSVINILESGRASLLSEEMEPYWSDISDHFTRVWDMLVEFKDEVEGLDDTFNTLYSYRTNETLRALTIISVILLPLTLISGIYGMNVRLPFEHDPHAFGYIVASMVVIALVMLAFFRHKGWF